jgi:organic hydroperoxide reductase OsmC/OhrA
MKQHIYNVNIEWTGNTGTGTSNYRGYERSHLIRALNKKEIEASSDPGFRGDRSRYNPEELLVASLSSCHMLWYLHLCAEAGIVVKSYEDEAKGTMLENGDGGGCFSEVILRPAVIVADETMIPAAIELHAKANELCFIANSVKFPVRHQPLISSENPATAIK